ncbi:MAG: septal ring lytic transglycosylase RlpA family protein [bacterium]|nr:septal ring lytic transglycosylase RlpA family protein [bacterium]
MVWSGFHGKLTANGEVFDQGQLTAAHKELPFGTVILLTNPINGKWTTARINDRGPFWEDRELDVSKAAARVLGMIDDGVVDLEYSIIDPRNKIPPPQVVYDGQSAD